MTMNPIVTPTPTIMFSDFSLEFVGVPAQPENNSETSNPITRVRLATTGDAETISNLVYDIVPLVGYGTPEEVDGFLNAVYAEPVIIEAITTGSKLFLVAEHDNKITGTVYLTPETGLFGGLYVFQPNLGTGRVLMEALFSLAELCGVTSLEGETLASNESMLALASRFGFAVTEHRIGKNHFVGQKFVRIVVNC